MRSIKQVIEEYGVANVRVFMPMSRLQYAGIIPGIAFTDSSDTTETECSVDESRYRVEDNYKVTFRALDKMFGYEHFYITDFNSLVERAPDTYRIYVLTPDGYQRIYLQR